jgi:hypothetical protein
MLGVEAEDMEESMWTTSVGDGADSRPTQKALAVGLTWSARVLGGGPALPYNKPSKTITV